MSIPFSPPYIDDDVKQEVLSVLDSGWITTGPKVKELEQLVSEFCNVEAALGVNSATSGMMLAMHWFGVQEDDEVIIPAYTYCATALAVMHLKAKPVMVDVTEDFTLDIAKLKDAITSKTKVILLVDFAGWPCDYEEVYKLIDDAEIKKKFIAENEVQEQLGRILVLSDAAHSFGAIYNNKRTGCLADLTVFSFHAVKNLTTAEGGMICMNMPEPFDNTEIYKTLRLWSLNGQTKDAFTKSQSGAWKYDIVYTGFKMNLPDVLAAIGLAQFRKYKDDLLIERKRVFETYDKLLSQHDWAILPPFHKTNCSSSYHLYPLRIKNITEQQRDAIINCITEKGVSVNVHFTPLPMLSVFKQKGYNMSDYPQSYLHYANEISLPVYSQLSYQDCLTVIDAVVKSVRAVTA